MAGTDTSSNTRSELLSVVAWVQIVGAGFALLVALLQFALAGVIWATAQAPQVQASNAWPIFGVGCLSLAGAVLLLLAGLGLRRRYHWARNLSILLCYCGAFFSVAFYVLEYLAVSRLFFALPGTPTYDTVTMLGTVFKTFLGGISLAATALLLWVGKRLGAASVRVAFDKPADPGADA